MLAWYKNVMLDSPEHALAGSYSYIDIRDVALAHVAALEKPDAGGQRIIVSNGEHILSSWRRGLTTTRIGSTTWQETSMTSLCQCNLD